MDPVLGAAIGVLIQSVAELAKKAGMSEEQAQKHFDDGYAEVKENIPGKLPDA